MSANSWPTGTFVRVRADAPAKAGLDGMVTAQFEDGSVGLIFGFDRYNRLQNTVCVGPELWLREELDLETLDIPNYKQDEEHLTVKTDNALPEDDKLANYRLTPEGIATRDAEASAARQAAYDKYVRSERDRLGNQDPELSDREWAEKYNPDILDAMREGGPGDEDDAPTAEREEELDPEAREAFHRAMEKDG